MTKSGASVCWMRNMEKAWTYTFYSIVAGVLEVGQVSVIDLNGIAVLRGDNDTQRACGPVRRGVRRGVAGRARSRGRTAVTSLSVACHGSPAD